MPKARSKTGTVRVPTSLAEADELIREIGEARREIQLIETSLDEKIAALKAKAAAESRAYQEKINQLLTALFNYAESHRNELTEGGKKKTVEVPSGKFSWRLSPPSVLLTKPSEVVIATLKALGLSRFVHRKVEETLDKAALSKRPDIAARVDGLVIEQSEVFRVEPVGSPAVSERTDKLARLPET